LALTYLQSHKTLPGGHLVCQPDEICYHKTVSNDKSDLSGKSG
jgi:hypothetical protein